MSNKARKKRYIYTVTWHEYQQYRDSRGRMQDERVPLSRSYTDHTAAWDFFDSMGNQREADIRRDELRKDWKDTTSVVNEVEEPPILRNIYIEEENSPTTYELSDAVNGLIDLLHE